MIEPRHLKLSQPKFGDAEFCSSQSRGAGDGDRTRMASLEGWSSTIELHPRVLKDSVSLDGNL